MTHRCSVSHEIGDLCLQMESAKCIYSHEHYVKHCLCLSCCLTWSKTIAICFFSLLFLKILHHSRTRNYVNLCCQHSAPHRCMFCPTKRNKKFLNEITNTTEQQLVLCSENAFEKRKCMRAFFVQRSPLWASTRLAQAMYKRGGEKKLACWMRKRQIDESSFGFSLTYSST